MTTQAYVRPQTIFQSVTSMFTSAAGAVQHASAAVSKVAETGEVLADTGLDMAKANQAYMKERTVFEHDGKMTLLKQEQTARDAALVISALEADPNV